MFTLCLCLHPPVLQLLTRHEQLEELDHECTHLEELRAAIKHQLHGLALEAVTLDRYAVNGHEHMLVFGCQSVQHSI